jgi:hypothetical protein
VEVAREQLGIPTPRTRPTMAAWRARKAAKAKRERKRKRSKAGPS